MPAPPEEDIVKLGAGITTDALKVDDAAQVALPAFTGIV